MKTVNANSFPDLPPVPELLEPWIETYTGKKFHFLSPSYDEIDIEDIAHALSNECRFGGHTREFYSVAEHCILVATLLPDNLALSGLLHDASEAYIRDIPSPVKQYLTNYKGMEEVIQSTIFEKYNCKFNDAIKEADTLALKAEARLLLPSQGADWLHLYPTELDIWKELKVQCFNPKTAKQIFIKVFNHLTGIENVPGSILVPDKRIILAQ